MKLTMKQHLQKKSVKYGAYSMGISAVVIAIVIVVNLIAGSLPINYTQHDFSDLQLYALGDETDRILEALDTDVDLYLIAEEGAENAALVGVLERYAAKSEHIHYTQKDPVIYPNFTKQYTEDTLSANSVIVAGEKRAKVIAYSDIFVTSMDYYYYGTGSQSFDGEGQITSAINYVTSDDLAKVYVLEGHGEIELGSTLTDYIAKANLETEPLNLLKQETVPGDCDALMINCPQSDFSAEEAEKIIAYLEAGGNVFMVGGYTGKEMPNLSEVLAAYGLSNVPGVIVEGNSNYYYPGAPSYLIPEMESNEIVDALLEDSRLVLFPSAQGIQVSESLRSSVTVNTLLRTSEAAYSKTDPENYQTLEKESQDIDGPFALGVAVTEAVEDGETKLAYFSSRGLTDENTDNAVAGNNSMLAVNTLNWMCEQEESVSIPVKSMDVTYLTVTAGDANFWMIVTAILIPLGLLIIGTVIWFRRKRR